MIVAVYGAAVDAPRTASQRDAFCSYAGDVLQHYPSVRDVVIWNEANLSYFWQPQFDDGGSSAAPAAYEALLASCWDTLHAIRPDVNVISDISSRGNDNPRAVSNISHSPGTFIAGMGAAYRASGRARPLFDTFGHHPYSQSNELPSRAHPGSTQMSEGDLDRLLSALDSAFGGTGRLVPGFCSAADLSTVWYLEAGYQTIPEPDKASEYSGFETEPAAIPDGDGTGAGVTQGSQLRAGLGLAYCQRAVGAFFNFLLADEPGLAGWQSGVLWADWTPKQSYVAFRETIAAMKARSLDCQGAASSGQSGGSAPSSSPGSGVQSVKGAASTAPKAPAALLVPPRVLRLAERFARSHLHLARLSSVESVRSRRDPRWALVDGLSRQSRHSSAFALWLHDRSGRWAVAKTARGDAVGRPRSGVPCDLARAFSHAPCA